MHHLMRVFYHIKKKLFLITIFIAIAPISNNISAEECKNCKVNVSFTGVYNEETCVIVINGSGNAETVALPEISTQSLEKVGTEAGSRKFVIELKECPTGRNIRLKFVSNISQADTSTGNLLNTSGPEYSENVQIRLRKEDGTQIKIDDLASAQNYFIPESGEMVAHEYIANYYANGNAGATAGLVKTTAGIEIYYK